MPLNDTSIFVGHFRRNLLDWTGTHDVDPKRFFRLMVLFTFLFGILFPSRNTMALTSETLRPNRMAEKWILEKVEQGKPADLIEQFPEWRDRTIRASFLEDLLTSPTKRVGRLGIRIANALIAGPLDLQNAAVSCETWLCGCIFSDKVNFAGCLFEGNISLEGSAFTSGAIFGFLRAKEGVILRKSVFSGQADFGRADIGGVLQADRVIFASSNSDANFNGITVRQSLIISGSKFEGGLDLTCGYVAKQLVAYDIVCTSPKRAVDFNGIEVGGAAVLSGSKFAGPVDFANAVFNRSLFAERTQFINTGCKADFAAMTVKENAFFTTASFAGPVSFTGLNVGGQFVLNGVSCTNNKAIASFNGMKVAGGALFNRTVFLGRVDFISADMGSYFEARPVQFGNAVFFDYMKVHGPARFESALFGSIISMPDAKLTYLSITGPEGQRRQIPCLDLSRTIVAGGLLVDNFTFDSMNAESLQVEGPAELDRVTIINNLNIERSTFRRLVLSGVTWPTSRGAVRLDGMECRDLAYFTTGPAKREAQKLLSFLGGAPYDANTYANLEASFRARGQRAAANSVFVERKRRERREPGLLSWPEKFLSCVFDHCLGYGRVPEPPVVCSISVVILGWISALCACCRMNWRFQRRNEKTPKERWRSLVWRSWWYTLGLFWPTGFGTETFLDLRCKPGFVLVWMAFLRVAGLILFGAIVASLTGIMELGK